MLVLIRVLFMKNQGDLPFNYPREGLTQLLIKQIAVDTKNFPQTHLAFLFHSSLTFFGRVGVPSLG